jgi:long-chain fatty acid transport protein
MKRLGATRRPALLAAAVGAGLGACSAAHAAGFYLQEQSVKGAGRAFSGEAADVGPESLWWNPAAIGGATQRSAYLGASGILPSSDVNDTGTLIVRPLQAPASVGGDPHASGPIKAGLIPSGAGAIPLNDKIALGLALTAPFDFTTQYDAASWARYTALTTSLRTIDVQPSIAVAPTDWLRVGVGLNAEYSDARLANALPNLSPLLPDGYQELKGTGWDFGWSAGAQVHNARVTVGVSYKSSIEHKLDGSVTTRGLLGPLAAENGAISAKARFRTPWQAIAGLQFKATDRLVLNLQLVRLGWSEFDSIRLAAPINAAIPENYRDTWSVAGGADYALSPKWTVRGGLQFDQTPTRDGQRDTRVPDADRIDYAVGASYEVTSAVTLDASLVYTAFDNAKIDRPTAAYAGTPVQTPILVSGEVNNADAVVVAFGGRFSF